MLGLHKLRGFALPSQVSKPALQSRAAPLRFGLACDGCTLTVFAISLARAAPPGSPPSVQHS
eukprot:606174-Prorocentrum_lima.AAC.1